MNISIEQNVHINQTNHKLLLNALDDLRTNVAGLATLADLIANHNNSAPEIDKNGMASLLLCHVELFNASLQKLNQAI